MNEVDNELYITSYLTTLLRIFEGQLQMLNMLMPFTQDIKVIYEYLHGIFTFQIIPYKVIVNIHLNPLECTRNITVHP
jgi:hypothetical protein